VCTKGKNGPKLPPGIMREKVQELYARGLSQRAIARKLDVAKSTVAFHVRRFGVPVDARFSRRYDWKQIERAHHAGMSVRECARVFGFNRGSWHKAVERGAIRPRDHRIPLEELLVAGRRTSRTHLKNRLIAAGLKENRCERCDITEWRGEPMNMQLHHKNGNGRDNRLPNLEFLCANCHSLTDTWGGRNAHRKSD
jgi:hypothetical protein